MPPETQTDDVISPDKLLQAEHDQQQQTFVTSPDVSQDLPPKPKPTRTSKVNAEQQKQLNNVAAALLGERRHVADDPETEKPETERPTEQEKPAKPAATKPGGGKPPAKPESKPEEKRFTEKEIAEITAKATAEAVARAQAGKGPGGGAGTEEVDAFAQPGEPGAEGTPSARPSPTGEGATQPVGKPGKPDPQAHLTASEKRQVPVLKEMEKLDPEKYKGLADKFVIEAKIISDYVAKWEKENPGKEFDPEDPDHNEFFEKHSVDWEDSDFQIAAGKIASREEGDRVRQDNDTKFKQMQLTDRARELGPAVEHAQKTVARAMFGEFSKEFGEQYGKIIGNDLKVNLQVSHALAAEDPAVAPVIFSAVERAEMAAAETVRLFNGFGMVQTKDGRMVVAQYDANNMTPLQQDIVNFALRMDQEMMARPEEERMAGGKAFAPNDKYWAMPEKERAKHWTFDAQNLNALRMHEIIEEATGVVHNILKSRELRKGRTPAPEQEQEDQPAARQRGPTVEKPISPSTHIGTAVSQRLAKGAAAPKEGAGTFIDGFMNGKSRS